MLFTSRERKIKKRVFEAVPGSTAMFDWSKLPQIKIDLYSQEKKRELIRIEYRSILDLHVFFLQL